ncbi:MAG: hypothetical protein R3267_11875 [Paenisporosarcina sp.]|nr:hypothetical protein [Paenisporosarcina sp.]
MTTIKKPEDPFVQFVLNGEYQKLKQQAILLKQAKDHLKSELMLKDGKRHEYSDLNMVAKFVAKEVRQTNHEKMIESLFDYVKPEVALSVLSLDKKRMVEVDKEQVAKPFLLPVTYHNKPYLSKPIKEQMKLGDYLFGGQSLEEMVKEIRDVSQSSKVLQESYEQVMKDLLVWMNKENAKKITTPVGSVSRIANQDKWNMESVFNELGEDFLSNFGKVDLSLLDEYVLEGKIPRSIITDNREIVDIQLTFVVMDLETEARILNIHNRKRSELSLKRFA